MRNTHAEYIKKKEVNKMKGIHVFFGALALVALFVMGSYNGLVAKDEAVSGSWSEVQNQTKRRADLIPNLVETVKGYATHEREVFTQVADARARVGEAIKIDASQLANSPELQKQMLDVQKGLNASLGRLIAVAENYPALKADATFLKLQDALEGTENRIGVARGRAIEATQSYNRSIRTFPAVVIARFGGFEPIAYYNAPEESQAVPMVKF